MPREGIDYWRQTAERDIPLVRGQARPALLRRTYAESREVPGERLAALKSHRNARGDDNVGEPGGDGVFVQDRGAGTKGDAKVSVVVD